MQNHLKMVWGIPVSISSQSSVEADVDAGRKVAPASTTRKHTEGGVFPFRHPIQAGRHIGRRRYMSVKIDIIPIGETEKFAVLSRVRS